MIFGGLVEIRSDSGTIVLIAVSIFLLIFDASLHKLEAYCHRNGFKGLAEKLIREFMVMGLLSFGTYIAKESFKVESSPWLYAFDFAHIIVLFVALAFVGQAIGLIIVVNSKNKLLLKYSAVSCEQLLQQYEELESTGGWKWHLYHHGPISLSYPDLRGNIEYKIMEGFFIKTFNLPAEFNFAHYMNRTLKKYVISLVEVRPINWLIFSLLVVINYIRIQTLSDYHSGGLCDYPALSNPGSHSVVIDSGSHSHMSLQGASDSIAKELKEECTQFLLRYVFVCLQIIVVYVCALLVTSEIYMLRLLGKVTDAEQHEQSAETTQKSEQANQLLNQMHSLFADWDFNGTSNKETSTNVADAVADAEQIYRDRTGSVVDRFSPNSVLHLRHHRGSLDSLDNIGGQLASDGDLNDALSSEGSSGNNEDNLDEMEANLKSHLQV